MMQTLAEIEPRLPVAVTRHASGAMVLPDAIADEGLRAQLWRLSDYLVSSVVGGSIWLVKKGRQ